MIENGYSEIYSEPIKHEMTRTEVVLKILPEEVSKDNLLDKLTKIFFNVKTDFIEVKERIPFPIHRIQTDRGQEFFTYAVQEYFKKQKIKFRPIKPLSPHLNGKVERTQRTDLDEFYSSVDPKDPELQSKLIVWEECYNKQRAMSSLHNKTPWEKYKKLENTIPSIKEIQESYDTSKERFAVQNYKYDQELKSLNKQRNKLVT